MRITFLLLLSAVQVYSAAVSSNGTGGGNFNAGSSWSGGAVPGIGDTVNIANGDNITVSDSRTWGTSPADQTTVVLHLNATGKLTVVNGGQIHVRGNSRYTSGPGNNSVAIECQQGSICELWDSSAAADPKPEYTYGPDGGAYGERALWLVGSVLRSNPGGARGRISLNGTTYGSRLIADRTDLIGISQFEFWFGGFGSPGAEWDVRASTFTNCAPISGGPTTPLNSTQTFRHNLNRHVGTTGGEIMRVYATGPGGTHEIIGNVFDQPLTLSSELGGFVIEGNYFDGGFSFNAATPPSTYRRNFIRWLNEATMRISASDMKDTYIFGDTKFFNNPHTIVASNQNGAVFSGLVYNQFGGIAGAGMDNGDFLVVENPPTVQGYHLRTSIFPPNAEGRSTMVVHTCFGDRPNVRAILDYNTWYGGNPYLASIVFVNTGEGSATCQAGWIASLRNNVFWGLGGGNGYGKFGDIFGTQTNICGACDYNTSYNATLGSNKGYGGLHSPAPGANDKDNEDPGFFDYRRTLELFDVKYYRPYKGLGTAPNWVSSSTYSTGDMVQNSVSGIYWGEPITYRYLGCGSNPEPGSVATYDTWRPCWEFASLYRIREGILSQETFSDLKIGAYGEGIIVTLLRWVRAGYAPSNHTFENGGYDGVTDVGAVAVMYGGASGLGPTPPPTGGGVSVRIRGKKK